MRRGGRLLVTVCAGLALLGGAGCSGSSVDIGAQLVVSPATSRADEAVTVRLQGVSAGTEGTLSVSAVDRDGTTWSAQAPASVGTGGNVSFTAAQVADPTATPASVGPRQGDDPTLLVSALQPPSGSSAQAFFWPAGGTTFSWTFSGADGSSVASANVHRELSPSTARFAELTQAKDGVVGAYEAVPDGARHPAVLFLGGSEGGYSSKAAALFAARGIPTLAQAYFKATGLPSTLSRIPLETFDAGLAWLRAQPEVDPARIWVVGGSRGSEAALLEASRRPDLVHGVVALSPSGVVHEAYPSDGHSAWTVGGQEVPFTQQRNRPDPTDVPSAIIPVEHVGGPVVAVCGGSDTLWASCTYAEAIMSRLDDAGFQPAHEIYDYPQAGHHVDLLVPYQPAPASSFADGVSPQQDELARIQVWPKVLQAIQTS